MFLIFLHPKQFHQPVNQKNLPRYQSFPHFYLKLQKDYLKYPYCKTKSVLQEDLTKLKESKTEAYLPRIFSSVFESAWKTL